MAADLARYFPAAQLGKNSARSSYEGSRARGIRAAEKPASMGATSVMLGTIGLAVCSWSLNRPNWPG